MVAPVNNLIVTIEKKFYDSVTFDSGQTIYFDPTWQPEEYTMLRAKVVSVPVGIINRHDYYGVKIEMKPGDEIYMRYDVIYAYKDQPDRDSPIYKNLLFQWDEEKGRFEELWKCDILQIFAIIRDQIIMVNDYVMLNPIRETLFDYSKNIIRPDNFKEALLKDQFSIRHIGENKFGLKAGDKIYVNPKTVMCYTINTDKFYLIKQRNILAKVD